jgi:sugar lactone lactonase YvrE
MSFGYALYFTERSRNRVIRWDPDSGDTDIVAGEPADGKPDQLLSDPYGLAFDRQGTLHVSDKLHHRICKVAGGTVKAVSLKDSKGSRSPKPGRDLPFNPNPSSPTGLFAEASGSLLCTFVDDYTIYRIWPDGDLELVLGIPPNRTYLFGRLQENVPPPSVLDAPIHGPTAVVKRADGTIFFVERMTQALRQYHPSSGIRCVFPHSLFPDFNRRRTAPDRASTQEYHPAFPSALALDAQDVLYMADIRHGCVLRIDPAPEGEVRKVVEVPPPTEQGPSGISALAFGPDRTAWIVNSRDGAIEAYEPTDQGLWKDLGIRLSSVRGSRLAVKSAGSGIAVGK